MASIRVEKVSNGVGDMDCDEGDGVIKLDEKMVRIGKPVEGENAMMWDFAKKISIVGMTL